MLANGMLTTSVLVQWFILNLDNDQTQLLNVLIFQLHWILKLKIHFEFEHLFVLK